MAENETIEERIVPPGETMIINGRKRGAGYVYKVKIKKNQPVKEGDKE